MNKRFFTACLAIACLLPTFTAEAQSDYFFRSKKKKPAKEASAQKSKFDQAITGATKSEGPFTVYFTKKNEVFFAMPDSAFKRDYLLSSRVAATSDTREAVAGQMSTDPFLIKFSRDSANVYLHRGQVGAVVREDDPIVPSFKKNFLDPVLKAFPIVDTKNGVVLVDVTKFFREDEKSITPLTILPPYGAECQCDQRYARPLCQHSNGGEELPSQRGDQEHAHFQDTTLLRAIYAHHATIHPTPAGEAGTYASARQPRGIF